MTDEEKAEEYLEPIHRMYSCNNEHYTDEVIIQAYLDGTAEGRKEGYEQGKNNERELQCGKKNYEKDIVKLEKENEELNEQLKNNPYVQILQNEKSEMAEDFAKQIEKMKVIEKENPILKSIISTILDKEAICYICQMKGQVLPECMRMENSECLKNMISLWSKTKEDDK